jgi:DNA helicase-2/ATP-dependent DNA helicase PcrA
MTIDGLVCDIVRHLLRAGAIAWINGHDTLEVLDDWRGHRGYRWLVPGNNYRRIAVLDSNNRVTSEGRRVTVPGFGFGNKGAFHDQLALGRCTHDDVRTVLISVLRKQPLKEVVVKFLASNVAHLVVDEVFDANGLDLALVSLACDADVQVTLVGDPWQALYGFRGAKPDLVPKLMGQWGFETLPLSESFRFESAQMLSLSEALRNSSPASVPSGGPYDVALASTWDALWSGSDHVLPLSFGRTTNQNDAAAIVLLDHLVHSHFSARAIFLPEALILLGLDLDVYREQGPQLLGQVVEVLTSNRDDAAAQALDQLRGAIKELGAARRPRAASGEKEQLQVGRLGALRARLRSSRALVPGMTIHQAKGREWDHVGVRLSPAETEILAGGLDPDVETHRALYVALTRARQGVTALP